MIPEWLYRLILAVGIILLGWVAARLIRAVTLKQVKKVSRQIEGWTPGIPAVVYFTTPDCVACKTTQRPALNRVKEKLGDRLQVIEINALEKPDLAQQWGVLSVPTTFILDGQGSPQQVNYGVTLADKLQEQIRMIYPEVLSTRQS